MLKVLVTGGAGMVGSHAAEYYARQGHQVTILDNLMRSKLFGSSKASVEYNWEYLATIPAITRIRGDVRNAADVAQALGDGADLVIHAAAQPGVGFSLQDPLEDFAINTAGTLTVLEAIRRRCPQAAVIFCSTNKVYGANVDRLPIVEQARRYAFADGIRGIAETLSVDASGHTPYGVSKLAAELYVQEYAHAYGLKTGVFRMSCVYGTRQFGFEDQGWVAHFAISTALQRPLTIYGDGKQVRDVLFVTDLIEAFERFRTSPLRHGLFNIGGGAEHTLSLLELLELLARQTRSTQTIRYADWRPSDQRVYISDIAKARRELSWQPTVDRQTGIGRLLAWIHDHRELF